MSPLLPFSPPTSPIRLDKVPRPPREIMIPTLQLLIVLIIDQPLTPEMMKQAEIGSRRPQRLAEHSVFARKMVHPSSPALPTVFKGDVPLTQRALY